MPRIAMIVWNEFRHDARVLKQAQTLQAAGYQVSVFALHTPGVTHRAETLGDGTQVIRVARRPFGPWRTTKPAQAQSPAAAGHSRPILRVVARLWTHLLIIRIAWHRAAVVHAHDVNTLPSAWLAARLSGAKLVYDAHEISTSREGYGSYRTWVARVERALMPRTQGNLTTTEARAKFFARAYAIARPLVLQNRPRFRHSAPTQRIRLELGLEQPWPIVVYQGGLQQGRGLERLLQVATTVADAYFVLIGGGKLALGLMALRDELGLAGRVHFIPTVPLADLPSYTASADIGVQPLENTCLNHFTTDSNKLFEYVNAGLPVIASDFPEIRRIVKKHDLGLLVRAGDDTQLRTALQCLVESPTLRGKYAGNASEAARHLNWEQQETSLVNLYQGLAQVRP